MTAKVTFNLHTSFPLVINGKAVGTIGLRSDDKGSVKSFADIKPESKDTHVKIAPDGTVDILVT
jgi:hypothetical protein